MPKCEIAHNPQAAWTSPILGVCSSRPLSLPDPHTHPFSSLRGHLHSQATLRSHLPSRPRRQREGPDTVRMRRRGAAGLMGGAVPGGWAVWNCHPLPGQVGPLQPSEQHGTRRSSASWVAAPAGPGAAAVPWTLCVRFRTGRAVFIPTSPQGRPGWRAGRATPSGDRSWGAPQSLRTPTWIWQILNHANCWALRIPGNKSQGRAAPRWALPRPGLPKSQREPCARETRLRAALPTHSPILNLPAVVRPPLSPPTWGHPHPPFQGPAGSEEAPSTEDLLPRGWRARAPFRAAWQQQRKE